MTLFGNFAPYDLHVLRPMVCGGFVVKTVAMTFKIPEKKQKNGGQATRPHIVN